MDSWPSQCFLFGVTTSAWDPREEAGASPQGRDGCEPRACSCSMEQSRTLGCWSLEFKG